MFVHFRSVRDCHREENFATVNRVHSSSTGDIADMSNKKKSLSAEQRTLQLKQQLLTEELVVTDHLVQSIDAPLDQSDVDDINKVSIHHTVSEQFLNGT